MSGGFEAGRVHACASRVSRAVRSFPSGRLKLRTTSIKRCDTCTNLHTGSTGVCLTRPRGQIYARRCLSTRVHVCTHAATFKSLDLAARSLFFERSLDRSIDRGLTDKWTILKKKRNEIYSGYKNITRVSIARDKQKFMGQYCETIKRRLKTLFLSVVMR